MRVFDTLTGEKKPLVDSGAELKMYACGITPYDASHLGHALSAIVFDVIRRYLEFRGFRVRYVQNFTDIDDKIIQRAQREGVSTGEIAERYIQQYLQEMEELNVRRAHAYPRPTQEIPRILQIIQVLVDKGYAYSADGDVYFRVERTEDYGKLSHRSQEGLDTVARVERTSSKERPMDFALWKGAKPGEPFWDSPWGPGRPGWHIECSAMCLGYLGETVDLHGGGRDLIFPHHENEIAQTEAYTGVKPSASFWVHNGLLQMGEEKMSKSLGNLITVRQALDSYSADAIRLFFLSSHYRSPLAYSEGGLAAQERALERLRRAAEPAPAATGAALDPLPFRERFLTAMDDDFNTPQALGVLFDLAREINRGREEGLDVEPARGALLDLAGVLGLTLHGEVEARVTASRPLIDLLVQVREELRAARQFALGDRIRDRLKELGIDLEDTPEGTKWRSRVP
ncbi:MAG: cysteine--tRNA ligase [Dehalococcoidia bacterium]|nr:cysteine--tRNA ligase [Dehalococcoidia bacterium]